MPRPRGAAAGFGARQPEARAPMNNAAHRAALSLRLYVAGTAAAQRARRNLEAALARLGLAAEIEEIDVAVAPHRAMEDGILVTPTLERLSPPPAARLSGELGDPALLDRLLRPG